MYYVSAILADPRTIIERTFIELTISDYTIIESPYFGLLSS